jgi:hypothetical protein
LEGGITSLSPITHKEYKMSKDKKTTLDRNIQRAIKNGQLDIFLKDTVFNSDGVNRPIAMLTFSKLMEKNGVKQLKKKK